ncbi:AbaSI family restriction endonuclease [Perlabentimonas gracilis]|uniref:AbaSI family restriction endonuclease n=1 Tax=Perlabentimonas gracilis TaxID=2715279 RepID=UPI00140D931D|nr:hypothetical protein [Perlabentimonas gracilis]NHB70320.1 hypothetical protein [Perlabentimonas gracilis]
MSYKLDYISRLFQRTSSKRIEHYVITRIWHLIDNYDVKITPQQYVTRQHINYALTDVYFPQVGIHVEINEPAHYYSNDRIINDLKRRKEIETNTGHSVFVIDCSLELKEIHSQIDELVSLIKKSVNEKVAKGTFKPWCPEKEHNPIYWKEKGIITISDEVSFHTIEDICLLFDADHRKTIRGFLRKGGIQNPKRNDLFIWWPSERQRSGWINTYDEINGTITETHSDTKKKVDHFNWHTQGSHYRIVFFHYKDILGLTNYKYVGVFTNDKELSNAEIGTVWTRIGETINIMDAEYQ